MLSTALTVAVSGGTFALLARPRLGEIPLSRSITSAVGALAVVALGVLSPEAALASLDTTTLLLLFGMLCHVEALGRSGCYEWAGAVLVERSATTRGLTLGALGLSALLSAVALNDATVLLLTPVLVMATRRAEIDPLLPLVALILGANIGSLATPLGNPQNAYILAHSGMATTAFITTLLPVTLLVLAITAVILAVIADTTAIEVEIERPELDRNWALSSAGFILVTLVLIVLLASKDPGVIATTLGVAHLAWLQFFRQVPGSETIQEIDWSILVMFAGIFVLVGALEQVGIGAVVTAATERFSLAGVTFVLSNLVSNVPAVVLLAQTVSSLDGWFVLAAVSTLAGTATPIGSAATLIVLDGAKRENVDLSLSQMLSITLPIALLTSVIAVGVIHLW